MSLLTIRNKVKERAGVNAQGEFWTDSELNNYINEAYLYYWSWLFEARSPRVTKSVLLDFTANQAEIALPSDFHEARLVERVLSTGTQPMTWKERFDRGNFTNGTSANNDFFVPDYRFEGLNILIEPTPDTTVVGAVKLTYFFNPTELVNDTDELDTAFPGRNETLIVYRATIIAKTKEEGIGGGGVDLGPWYALLQQEEIKFKQNIELPTVQRLRVEPVETYDYGVFY